MDEFNRSAASRDADVRQLTETSVANTTAIGRAEKRLDRVERDRKAAGVAIIALALLLILAFAYLAYRADQHVHAEQAARAADNQRHCPHYGILLGTYDPASRDNSPDPLARQKYEDTFAQIRRDYQTAGCTNPVVPPSTR